jgi:hypothetical protein
MHPLGQAQELLAVLLVEGYVQAIHAAMVHATTRRV